MFIYTSQWNLIPANPVDSPVALPAASQDPETPKTPKRVSLALGDESTKSPRSEETMTFFLWN